MNDISLPAGKFKATCLKVMDEVAATGRSFTITKRGKPVAKVVAVPEADDGRSFFGSLAHCTRIIGDIESPVGWTYDPVMKFKRVEARALPIPKRKSSKKS